MLGAVDAFPRAGFIAPWRNLENTRFWPPSATQLSSVAVLGFGIARLTGGMSP